MSYNKNKQYRISHTEEKIIELLRDENSWKEIYSVVMDSESFKSFVNIKFMLSIFEGQMSFENNNDYKRGGTIRSVIKRLKECEFMCIMYIRRYGASIFTDLNGDYVDYALISINANLFKLYNLITRGISKTFDDLIKSGFITEGQKEDLVTKIDNGDSICIVGDLNTGKVTLLNAIVYSLSEKKKKTLIVDEKSELQLDFLSSDDSVEVISYKDLNMELIDDFESKDYTLIFSDLGDRKALCFLSAIEEYIRYGKVNVIGVVPNKNMNDFLLSTNLNIFTSATLRYSTVSMDCLDSKKCVIKIE